MTNYRNRRKKPINRTFEVVVAVLAVLLVCCAYAGAIDPQRFILAPFLGLAFMPILVLLALALICALIWRRWIAVAVVIVSLMATAPIIKLFMPLNSSDEAPPVPADPTMILKVMTYNVLSFNYNEPNLSAEPSATMRLILDANPDVVLLQEGTPGGVEFEGITSIVPYLGEIKKKYPYCYYGNEGLNLMSKYPFTTQLLGMPQHERSPLGYNRNGLSYLARAFDLQLPSGKQIRLVDFRLQSYHLSFGKNQVVRVSPDVKPSRLERMRRSFALRDENATALRKVIDDSPANLIVCGDMNDITASHVYRVICGNDLKDAWAEAGNGYAYTYNRFGLCYRIDHILYRGAIRAIDAERLKGGSSDHYPMMVTFDLDINM
jgi:endonuclease/exonuclease/phosphatase (EEP) superfamily protein YafD